MGGHDTAYRPDAAIADDIEGSVVAAHQK